MNNEVMVYNSCYTVEIFMKEMLASQVNGCLSEFVLDKWDFIVDCELDGDYEKMDIVIATARACIEKSSYDLYTILARDIMKNNYISIDFYREEINKLEDKDNMSTLLEIKDLKTSLKKSMDENKELKKNVEQAEKLIMEALDMMMMSQ